MNKLKEIWNETPLVLRRIICAELCILAALVILLISIRVVSADTYECAVHKGEWVWIRETPSRDGRKIGRVRYGYQVDAAEPENGYLRIGVRPGWLLEGEHAEHGYVDAQYFDRPVEETMYRVVCEGPLAKRETPGGRLMCWIKPGSKISVLGWRYAADGSLWAHVYKGGYVKGSYLGEL